MGDIIKIVFFVIPGPRKDDGPAANEQIKNWLSEEQKNNQCRKCGQYIQGTESCPNPGPQCSITGVTHLDTP